MAREQLILGEVEAAQRTVHNKLYDTLETKGWGTFASRHEILGVVVEEVDELVDAVRDGDNRDVERELIDIAVGCIFAVACIRAGKVEW